MKEKNKTVIKSDMVQHSYNPSPGEIETVNFSLRPVGVTA
jgi:hypothetical protein